MQTLNNTSIRAATLFNMNAWQKRLVTLFCLLLLADWLFYNQNLGISLVIFLCALATGIFLTSKSRFEDKASRLDIMILILCLLPLVEELNTLSFLIGCIGIINFTFNQNRYSGNSLMHKISLGLLFITSMPFKFLGDMIQLASIRKKMKLKYTASSFMGNWALPLAMTCVFLFLFALANPLISAWIADLEFLFFLSHINFERVFFWLLIAFLCWSFLKPSLQKLQNFLPKTLRENIKQTNHISSVQGVLNEPTVFRSLVLFNALFAVQTALDFQYLWIGQTLPNGVTFSEYVHNGTYILIFTTLLAASFILYVTGTKKRHEKSPRIMGLLLMWITQNIILVMSNVMRMELYVEAFALTYLRLSVLIWLTLVIIGLTLIIIRLLKRHSNIWLIKTNLISLATILYLMSFANLPYLIASYNVTTAEQNLGKRLDIQYIIKLGPNALPALKRISDNPKWQSKIEVQKFWMDNGRKKFNFQQATDKLIWQANHAYSDWRQWNFRDYRLQHSIKQINASVLPN